MEEWRNYNGTQYDVSNYGRVRSNHYGGRNEQRLLKLSKTEKGYVRCMIYEDGRLVQKKVHRMVAEMFLDRVEGKDEVNHKDGNKLNNHVDNLEWCNRKENMRHAHEMGFMKNAKEYAKRISKPVVGIFLCDGKEARFNSVEEASRELNIRRSNIFNVLHGKYHKTHGMVFRYEKG